MNTIISDFPIILVLALGVIIFLFTRKNRTNNQQTKINKKRLKEMGSNLIYNEPIKDTQFDKNIPQNGFGTFTFPSPLGTYTYTGMWKDGLKHGKGVEINASGNIINEGVWDKGVFTSNKNITKDLVDDKLLKPKQLTKEQAAQLVVNDIQSGVISPFGSNATKNNINDDIINIKDILGLDTKKESVIEYNYTEVWKQAYFQNMHKKIDPNSLPTLDDKYLCDDNGDLLCNNKGEAVFDPNQEIKYEFQLEKDYKRIYKSKNFIGLFKEKIRDLEIDDDGNCDKYELMECLDLDFDYDFPVDDFLHILFSKIGCDNVCIEDSEDNNFLWFSSTQLDAEYGELKIDGITLFTNYL
tara:strand:- start:703 stop:1764 length:1062 start_codon:yes stop_codon:yes gene_type:complete